MRTDEGDRTLIPRDDSSLASPFLPSPARLDDDFYMALALEEAWKYQGLTLPNPAVGALIRGAHGEILALAAHQGAGKPHAEVLALQQAYARLSGEGAILQLTSSEDIHRFLLQNHRGLFHACTIYVTLEPCNHHGKTPPCALLLSALKPHQVIIGTRDPHLKASGGVKRLKEAGIEVVIGAQSEACEALLYPFRVWQERGGFCFFKVAQRLNGTIEGGTISSEASRQHVHALRDKVDLLVISGQTVRVDDPILDARLVGGRAPDVLILTRHAQSFKRDWRLFKVENRRVIIADSLAAAEGYHYVMIEGGAGLFSALRDRVDALLTYTAPSLAPASLTLQAPNTLTLLHVDSLGGDGRAWWKMGSAKA